MLRWAKTRERQPSCLEEVVLGADIAGKSVLHIGCSTGDLCRKALEKGAASVTGIDLCRQKIDEAGALSSAPRDNLNFIAADFEQWDAASQAFDIVVCSNILHHLYEPVAAIRKIMQLAGERFAVQVTASPPAAGYRSSLLRCLIELNHGTPIYLSERKTALRATDQTFVLSRRALEIIINRHSKAFEPALFTETPNGRLLVEAHRRRIDHLIVVAGSTASGKSSLIRRLAEPKISRRFGIDPGYRLIKPEEIEQLPAGRHKQTVLHYDLLRPFGRALQSHERDPSFHLLQCADRVTIITIAQRPEVLIERLNQRGVRRRSEQSDPRAARAGQKCELYSKPGHLRNWYEAWLDATAPFASRPADRSFFVLADEGLTDLGDRHGLLQLFEPAPEQRRRPSVVQVLSLAIAAVVAPSSAEAEVSMMTEDSSRQGRAMVCASV